MGFERNRILPPNGDLPVGLFAERRVESYF